MILTSSRVALNSNVDVFSDYDVELYVDDLKQFVTDDWLSFFGEIRLRWPLKPMLEHERITRLILFKNNVRIDFQITDSKSIDILKYDSGYKVLLDKDNIAINIKTPTYSEFVIKKPREKEFVEVINDFFWDGTYIVKCLWRDELYFAKYMSDHVIHFDYFQRMIEWYIGMQHDWSVSTNKYGRRFKKYLDQTTWKELESTFAGANIEENWDAFFNMVTLFSRLAKELADKLDYKYPSEIEENAIEYYKNARKLKK